MIVRHFSNIILILIFKLIKAKETDYCTLRCTAQGNLPNIVCERKHHCVLDKNECGSDGKSKYFFDKFLDEMVAVHNEYRQKIASGEDTRGGNSKASNMMVLSYHKELAYTAQCLANSCLYHHKCGRTPTFNLVGQNLYMKWSSRRAPPLNSKMIRESVYQWYIEIKDADEDLMKRFHMTAKQTGHFTQLVWAETKYVGCGASQYHNKLYVVCNYATAGNILGKASYKRGEPCSDCPSGTKCNSVYNALCGEIENVLPDKDFDVELKISAPDKDNSEDACSSLYLNIWFIFSSLLVYFLL